MYRSRHEGQRDKCIQFLFCVQCVQWKRTNVETNEGGKKNEGEGMHIVILAFCGATEASVEKIVSMQAWYQE